MKALLAALILVAIVQAQSPELLECIEANCPTQYSACTKNANCEDKLRKGEEKCGAKVDYACWSGFVIFNVPAQNVCFCAVDAGCLANVSGFDRLAVSLFQAISEKGNNLRAQ